MVTDVLESCRSCVYSSELFEGLSEEELEFLVNYTSYRSFRKGEIVFLQGDEIRYISFLKKGLLKVFKQDHESRGQIISIAKPNDCVGLLSVFSNHQHQYSIAALEDSLIYYIELTAVHHILRKNGNFGIRLLGRISRAADTIINNAFDISRKNIRGRIAFILHEFSEDIYKKDEFDLPVSRKEIGELIGMTTENVIRVFSEFRRDGIIEIKGKTIRILNKSLLQTLEKFG
ncbi:MAG: Crp/Fnr family transcriptional regulator [Bacteroidetes bacterium]|nr:Crp/Fnr family transcriptional regulator [Bacteroidota bacterium]